MFIAWKIDAKLVKKFNSGIELHNLMIKKHYIIKRVCSLLGFQLFIGKQSILVDQLPLSWELMGKTQVRQPSSRILQEISSRIKEIFSRWREYFKDVLKPVMATSTGSDKCDTIDFGKKNSSH